MTYRPNRRKKTNPAPLIVAGGAALLLLLSLLLFAVKQARKHDEKPVARADRPTPAERRALPRSNAKPVVPEHHTRRRATPVAVEEDPPALPTTQQSPPAARRPPVRFDPQTQSTPSVGRPESVPPSSKPEIDPDEQRHREALALLTSDERAEVDKIRGILASQEGVSGLELTDIRFATRGVARDLLIDDIRKAASSKPIGRGLERLADKLKLKGESRVQVRFLDPFEETRVHDLADAILADMLSDEDLKEARSEPVLTVLLSEYIKRNAR